MGLDDAHALVIGISRYLHLEALRDTQDAQDVAAVLQDPACCGYPPAAVNTLLDAAATRAAILDALDALARDTRETSTVFIYYSGHGALAGGDSYYLVPVDATNASRDELDRTAIPNAELTARLRAIPAGRLTLVLDCCRAADVAEVKLADSVAPLARGRGRTVIAASRPGGSAYQLPGQRDSNLTGRLVEGLRGAALGVGGVIRITDLFDYVQQHLVAGPLTQHPVFKAEFEENYPIALLRGGAVEAITLPPPTDAMAYDAFLSYCKSDPDDREWVRGAVVPYLEGLGLKLFLLDRDFQPGHIRVQEVDRGVKTSRYTVAVFTPAYLANAAADYQALLAASRDMDTGLPRFIPLLRRDCDLELHDQMAAAFDVRSDPEVPATLKRLALALREPPQPRRSS